MRSLMMAWQAIICATALVLTVPAMAMADSARFDIAAQPMPAALKAFAAQAHMQLLYQYGAVAHATGNAVVGELETHAALEQLLRNTGLEVVYSSPNAATIRPLNSSTRSSGDAGSRAAGQEPSQENPNQDGPQHKSFWDRFRLAQVDQGQTSSPSTVEKQDEQASKKRPIQLEEVLVTGSRIPTTAKESAQPVRTYTREQIEQSGQTTVAGFLQDLPDVSINYNESGFFTVGGITTVSLHGLPIGTTLILVNGRRLQGSGVAGGLYVDLNNVSLAAVERIEVISEGSSAIYGSDAIAGVVNIILKKDFDGFEANVKYGRASGIDESTTSLAWGQRWDRGSVSIIGSFQSRGELQGFERSVTDTGTKFTYDMCNLADVYSTNGTNLPGVGAPLRSGSCRLYRAAHAARVCRDRRYTQRVVRRDATNVSSCAWSRSARCTLHLSSGCESRPGKRRCAG